MTYEGKIGRFEVKRRIGRGGAGEVSLAFDPDNNREIALKVIHIGISDPEMLEAEKRGAEIQEQLSREVHQIARVYETGQIGDKFYIAMEYVRGNDLTDLLTGPLPPRLALSFACQLCAILEACGRVPLSGGRHRDRVVHGDIKPQNIRIEDEDRVRLLDFGVAKSVSLTHQFTGNVFGSLPYLSPERLTESRVSVQSDLWSLGVVLYQMLTGTLPYDGEPEEMMAAIRRGGLPQPPSPRLSPQLRQILARCLELSPSQRYTDAVSLREALEGVKVVEVADERGGTATQRTWPASPDQAPWDEPSPASLVQRSRPSFWERFRARFSRESRSDLQQLQERLRRLRGAVPSRARQFGGAVASLSDEMDKASQQLTISRGQVEGYRQRVAQFDQFAEPLTAAIREAEQVEKEVHLLEPGIQALADPRTKGWFEKQSRSWTTDLQKIGIGVRRPAELQDDRDQVKKLRDEIRFSAQVLARLDEAERVLSLLGESAQTEALAREMPELQDRLRQEGASEDWLEQLQTLVLPLREAAKQVKDPLDELRKIPSLLKKLQAWSQPSGELKREVEQLEQRHRSLGHGTKLPEVEALARDASEVRERFLRQARELREDKLAEIDQEVRMLASVAGAQPLLEERLRGLRRRQAESPQELADWMIQLEEIRDLFRSTAKNQENALEQGLAERLDQLRERLQRLHGLPLSTEAHQETENLRDEIREMAQQGGGGQALVRFRRTGEIERRIEQLHLQAGDSLQALSREKTVLQEHNAELQAEARLVGIELADLSQQIEKIGEGTSLEASRQHTDSLSAELDALRLQFEEQCRKILGERISEILAVSEALQRIGRSFPPPALSALANGISPREAAQAVAAGLELTRLAQNAAAQAFHAQEEILQRARSVLSLDHSNVLGPDERKTAEARLAEIESELANGETNPIGRLEQRAKLIEACEPLLSRLHQDERSAGERREALYLRLEKPEVDLRTFCPELTDRIAGLVYGIPTNPWQWKAVQDQLTEAEVLLARVEGHARRLAAEELDRAVRDLWPGDGDPSDTLWGQLRRVPRETLPPWSLRRKVLEAHERWQQGRRGRA